jgi:hypothetical protein
MQKTKSKREKKRINKGTIINISGEEIDRSQ